MARIGAGPDTAPETSVEFRAPHLTGQQFATIAWLRWRIFVNSLRGKGAVGELVVKIISYPILAGIVLGPSIGAGVSAYYLVDNDQVSLLVIPLWVIFALWQFIGMSTSASGPSFDLASLIRFPIRYRDYFLMRLSFGLMDPPTLAGIACLVAMCLGIGFASPALLPVSALVLFVYAACNVFFSRMIYSWLERWLAQRRTRELLTGAILILSLSGQFVGQFVQRISHQGQHPALSPFALKIAHVLVAINWLLPPGLTASSIDHIHRGAPMVALAALGGLLAYTVGFLFVLHMRLLAQFRGEDLSEAPAARLKTARSKADKAQALAEEASAGAPFAYLPATVAACLVKEIRYLLRSGPKLYVLVMPVFVVLLLSMRTAGFDYPGLARHGTPGILFSYSCAYMQLIFVSLLYNSLGGDGSGVQFYFTAPLRMRDVMLAKNLLTAGIFAIEAICIYVTAAVISRPAPADLTAATLAWSVFTLLLNMSVGNVRSIVSPRAVELARVRSQNVTGMNSFISMLVVFSSVALGALVLVLCRFTHTSLWVAAAIFLVLAALSVAIYLAVMNKIDGIAANHVESLTAVLSKV